MHLVSVQTGVSRPSSVAKQKATAIVKEPVAEAQIETEGLVGDVIVDLANHGGPDQAVYVYTRDDYEWWEQELGRSFPPGYFGENLTFSSGAMVPVESVRIGDHFTIGEVVLEVTSPRIPCGTFADRVGIADFVDAFRRADRPGMYCRVLTPGRVKPGDRVGVVAAPDFNLALVEAYHYHYDRSTDLDRIRRALESPVSKRIRADYERRLSRADHSSSAFGLGAAKPLD